jgi:ribosomal protein L37E
VYLYKYVRDAEYEYMTVYIQARMTDYIVDENTNKVVKGNPNTDYHPRYLFTFIRKVGVLTDPARSNNSVVACPHCGAPTQITSAGKCEYCGFIVTTGEFDWVLSDIEAVKAGSNIGKGGVIIRNRES